MAAVGGSNPLSGTMRIDITVVSQTLTLMNLVQLQNPQPPISSSRVEQRIVIPRIGVQVTIGRPTVLVYVDCAADSKSAGACSTRADRASSYGEMDIT